MAQQAVEREPGNALMHGLLGTLYYRLDEYDLASQSFRLALNGGVTKEGAAVTPIASDGGYTYIMYSSRFGIALANLGQCSEALQIAQKQTQLSAVDYLETAQINSQVMIDTCREVADSPVVTPSVEVTPTPGN